MKQEFIRASPAEKKDPPDGTDAFFAEQNLILERSTAGASLAKVLDQTSVCRVAHHGMPCSILLLDEENPHLRHGAAPSLSESHVKAIDRMPIGSKPARAELQLT